MEPNISSTWWEIIKVVSSMLTAAGSAYLGFWYACQREDRAVRHIAIVKLMLLDERLTNLSESQEVVDLHRGSIPDICPDLIRAIYTLSDRKKQFAQGMWDQYRKLNPARYEAEELFAEINAWQVQNTFRQVTKEELFTAQDAMARILKAIRDSLS